MSDRLGIWLEWENLEAMKKDVLQDLKDEVMGPLKQEILAELKQQLVQQVVGKETLKRPEVGKPRTSFNDAVKRNTEKSGESTPEESKKTVGHSGSEGIDKDEQPLSSSHRESLNDHILDSDDIQLDFWGFRGTCWDSAAFFGHTSHFRWLESVVVMFLVAVSATVQTLFIVIVYNNLTGSQLSDEIIDGFHFWRTNVGQDVRFMNPLTLESLSSRVCRMDSSLHLADRQVQYIGEIESYVFDNQPFNGPMMCMLAVFTWTLTVSKEFHALKDMWAAFLTLPITKVTTVHIVEPDPRHAYGRLLVQGFSIGRFCWLILLTICRVSIAVALLMAGCLFLLVTISIEDILLNAVALEFVLNVDELVYLALMPMKTRKFIALMRPLPIKEPWALWGVDFNFVLAATFSFGLCGSLFGFSLMPEIDKMKDAKDELCGGFTDFAYSVANWGQSTWNTEKVEVEAKMSRFLTSNQYKLVRTAIKDGNKPFDYGSFLFAHKVIQLTGAGWSVMSNAVEAINYFETINSYGGCSDIFFDHPDAQKNPNYRLCLDTIRDITGNQTVTLCKDLEPLCHLYEMPGPTVRKMCPHTCSCDSPGGPQWFYYSQEGCPQVCRGPGAVSAKVRKELADRTCTQTNSSLLVADPLWPKMLSNMLLAAPSFDTYQSYFEAYAQNVNDFACDMDSGFIGQACSADPPFKSLAFWCPIACQCNVTHQFMCPSDCVIGQEIKAGNQTPSTIR